jgi:hypothetical protein
VGAELAREPGIRIDEAAAFTVGAHERKPMSSALVSEDPPTLACDWNRAAIATSPQQTWSGKEDG